MVILYSANSTLRLAFYNKLAFLQKSVLISPKYFLQGPLSATSVIDILKGDDPLTKYDQLSNMYQKLADSIENTLNYLSDSTYQNVLHKLV